MNSQVIHIKREFWEHRSLWIAPLVWAGIITLMFAWTVFFVIPHVTGHDGAFMSADAEALSQLSESDRREVQKAVAEAKQHSLHDSGDKDTFFAFSYLALSGLVTGFASIVVFFYLIDCLYSERRDRSILFWKSLPISDARVVLSKLAVALVVVPLGALLLGAAMQLLMVFMVWARFHGTAIGAALPDLTLLAWFKSQAVALALAVGGVLWYAPIASYLLLMSSWARRNVFLWVVLPPAALAALEGFFFHSTRVLEFIGWRFTGYVRLLHVDPNALNVGARDEAESISRVGDVLSKLDLSGMFLNAEVWIALVVTAGMVFAAIRLRRYRDEN
jgi:ABC-2 type transport system permease protein